MDILEKMLLQCEDAGYHPTKNIEKVARAKNIMFGDVQWHRCPCDSSNNQRNCISDLCRKDIETKGVCHCNCYSKNKE